MNTVQVRRFAAADIRAVQRIADVTLGEGYLSGLDDAEVWVATVDDLIAGFATCFEQDRHGAETLARQTFPSMFRAVQRFGCIKTVAVVPSFQKHGVGAALIRAVVTDLRARVDVVWSVAWMHDDTVPIGRLLSGAGLEPFARVPDYWADDSLAKGYNCPACGRPPCRCSASLWAGR